MKKIILGILSILSPIAISLQTLFVLLFNFVTTFAYAILVGEVFGVTITAGIGGHIYFITGTILFVSGIFMAISSFSKKRFTVVNIVFLSLLVSKFFIDSVFCVLVFLMNIVGIAMYGYYYYWVDLLAEILGLSGVWILDMARICSLFLITMIGLLIYIALATKAKKFIKVARILGFLAIPLAIIAVLEPFADMAISVIMSFIGGSWDFTFLQLGISVLVGIVNAVSVFIIVISTCLPVMVGRLKAKEILDEQAEKIDVEEQICAGLLAQPLCNETPAADPPSENDGAASLEIEL